MIMELLLNSMMVTVKLLPALGSEILAIHFWMIGRLGSINLYQGVELPFIQ